NALFPVSMMPDWLQPIANVNPITYTTDAVRQLLLYETNFNQLMLDFAYTAVFTIVIASISIILAWRYLRK
ncbi:multidrug ABC transporter permease, partial [Candidatus Bathyarchaeota archaeon]